jgi:hypothetical protein
VFTGNPTAPTAAPGDNDTSVATTAFVNTAIVNYVDATNIAFCTEVNLCVAAITCAAIVGSWTPAGVGPGPAVGFLADDCNSYTVDQIFALQRVLASAQVAFTTSGVAGTDGVFTATAFANGVSVALNAGNARFTFTVVQADTEYSIAFGNGGPNNNFLPHWITKAITHFDVNVTDLGAAALAVLLDVTVSRVA